MRTERRFGELWRPEPKNPGGRPGKTGSNLEPVSKTPTLAERRMGEMLAATPRAKGAKGIGNPKKCGSAALPHSPKEPTLAALGISKRESAAAQKLAAISEPEFQEVLAGNRTRRFDDE